MWIGVGELTRTYFAIYLKLKLTKKNYRNNSHEYQKSERGSENTKRSA